MSSKILNFFYQPGGLAPSFSEPYNIYEEEDDWREVRAPRDSIMPLRTSTLDTCHFCKNMTMAALQHQDGYPHARTYEELEAVLDCKICRNFWPRLEHVRESLDKSVRLGKGTPAGIFLRIEDSPSGTVLRAFLRQGGLRDDFKIEDGEEERIILVTALEGDVASETGLTWDTDLMYTGARYYMNRAAKWLHTCQETHHCNVSAPHKEAAPRWPRRLLELCRDSQAVTLILIKEGFQPPYATLSYCWGPNGLPRTAKTTVDNISARQAHIDKQSLPRTFQDAIRVCNQLEIQYLWIDALCIVQDSIADWQSEGSNMGSIYRNSTITIAADSNEDAEGGLFYHLNSSDLEVKLTVGLSDGSGAQLVLHPTSITSLKPKISILKTRAWCFQERVLSPRVLHFFDCGILFECRKGYYMYNDPLLSAPAGSMSRTGSRIGKGLGGSSEEYLSFLQDELMIDYHSIYPSMADHELRFYQTVTKGFANALSTDVLLRPWFQTILKDYTARQLTFESDKLVAISSVAREIQHQTGATYLAGLWAEAIAYGLAWESSGGNIVSNDNDTPDMESAKHPSWSWTSSEAGCNWPIYESGFEWWYPNLHQTFSSHLALLSHQVEFVSSDPFGQVSGGRLEVRGKAFRGSYISGGKPGISGTFDIYIKLWTGEMLGFLGVSALFGKEDHVRIVQWESSMLTNRLCLLLCSKGTERFFLELQKVEEPNVYKRKNMFVVDHKAGGSFAYEEFMEFVDYGEEYRLILV